MGGIQVNHCKNPLCANFGIPPKLEPAKGIGRPKKGSIHAPVEPGDYIVSANGKARPALTCELCGEVIPMQSNLAVVEELMRIGAYLNPVPQLCCPEETCAQHSIPVDTEGARYKKSGKSAAGTPRHQCLLCKSTFSGQAKSSSRQRFTHKNRDVFLLLVNKSPLKRIAAVTGLNMVTLYRRISFIHKQCLLFAGERESRLMGRDLPTRYLATDRQMFVVNWASRKDRRNVQLLAIATADVETGYVFGMHLNFDGKLNQDAVALDMQRYGDDHLPQSFRRYARIWLPQDYEKERRIRTPKDRAAAEAKAAEHALEAEIRRIYADAIERDDVESSDQAASERQLPRLGVQVHEQVSMNAHIQFISRLLHRAEKLRFFVDQESGLRAAIMAALGPRIKARTADAWYVQVLKGTTVDEKRKATKSAVERFAAAQLANPTLSEEKVEMRLMQEQMALAKEFGHWRDRWVEHPLPIMTEPAKRMCWLTDLGDYDEDHVAKLYLKATLHPVDRYFMQIRRRLSLAERPISSAGNAGRIWNGYAAYQPDNLASVLEIFRVYFNFCESGADKKTPAMRLGLAKGPVALEDILYFIPGPSKAPE
ncbi:MAG: IS1 family transposase [Nitrosomonadales bacterium]|nr:IS1 family transposase [Nitrosomonadales bacterium]